MKNRVLPISTKMVMHLGGHKVSSIAGLTETPTTLLGSTSEYCYLHVVLNEVLACYIETFNKHHRKPLSFVASR